MTGTAIAPDMLLTADLQGALKRCMQEHPPSGLERRLHPDASRMAGLWAELILRRATAIPFTDIEPDVMQAWARWRYESSVSPG